MRMRFLLSGLILVFAVCLIGNSGLSDNSVSKPQNELKNTRPPIAEAMKFENHGLEHSVFAPSAEPDKDLMPIASSAQIASGSVSQFNGFLAGYTTWDFQQYSSTRQIDVNVEDSQYRYIHCAWTTLKTFNPIDPGRNVNYNVLKWTNPPSWQRNFDDFGGIHVVEDGDCGGYASIDFYNSGRGWINHQIEIPGTTNFSRLAPMPPISCLMCVYVCTRLNSLPDQENVFPRGVIYENNQVPNGVVYHVASRDSKRADGDPATLVYWRYFYDSTISSYVWEGPVAMDSNMTISHQMFVDQNSERVILAFAKPRDYGPDRDYYNNDLVYYESNVSGADWIANGGPPVAWENGGGFDITDYADSDPHRCFVEITGGVDSEGRLHLAYTNPGYDQAGGTVSTGPTELLHWHEGAPGSNENAVVSGGTPGGFIGGQEQYFHAINSATYTCAGEPGVWNRYISKPSLAFGDGTPSCNGSPNQDYLYVVYTQFGSDDPLDQADASASGYQNGNVWLSVSGDAGETWCSPRCITTADGHAGGKPTRTPGCDVTVGDTCLSEHWPSAAITVNDTLHVFYLGDTDAGSDVHGEGNWSVSPVLYRPVFGEPDGSLCPTWCPCGVWGDVNLDGMVNPVDVIIAVNSVYKCAGSGCENSYDLWPHPGCEYCSIDVTCDGAANPVDVVCYVNYVYKGQPWALANCVDADGSPATADDIGCR